MDVLAPLIITPSFPITGLELARFIRPNEPVEVDEPLLYQSYHNQVVNHHKHDYCHVKRVCTKIYYVMCSIYLKLYSKKITLNLNPLVDVISKYSLLVLGPLNASKYKNPPSNVVSPCIASDTTNEPNEPVDFDEPLTNVDDTLRLSLPAVINDKLSADALPIPVFEVTFKRIYRLSRSSILAIIAGPPLSTPKIVSAAKYHLLFPCYCNR